MSVIESFSNSVSNQLNVQLTSSLGHIIVTQISYKLSERRWNKLDTILENKLLQKI